MLCVPAAAWAAETASKGPATVRVADHDGYTRFVVESDHPIPFSIDALIQPAGLVVDVPELPGQSDMAGPRRGTGVFKAYHYLTPKPGKGQIIIETTGPVAIKQAFVIQPGSENANYRLVIDMVATASTRLAGSSALAAASPAPPPSPPVAAPAAAAQQPAPEQQAFLASPQPGRAPLQAPTASPYNLTIEAPRKSPVPRATDELSFVAKDVQVAGVTAYGPAEIRPLITDLIGRRIGLADLVAAAERIEALYQRDGYLLTQAFVPAQSVTDGIFRITVIEGYVSAVQVKSDDSDARERVESLTASLPSHRPLNIGLIERALVSANQLPGVSASGLLRPSETEPGASDFVVTVNTPPVVASLSADNRGAKNTGVWTLSADSVVRSPFGDGGQLSLNATATPNFHLRHSLQGKYQLPLSDDGLVASISGLISHGEPAGSISQLQLITDNQSYGARLSYPLYADHQRKLIVETGFTAQSADVHALGAPFSRDVWRDADAALIFQDTVSLDGVSNFSVDFIKGVPGIGATPSGSPDLSRPGASTDFSKLTGSLSHTRVIAGPVSLSLSLSGQYGFSRLLTGEEINFGGVGPGRGYDPGALTGDSGAGAASELRYDFDAEALSLDQLQIYGLYDAARVWLHDEPLPQHDLQSVGGGVRLGVFGHLSLGTEFVHGLLPLPTSGDGKRENRVLFSGSVRL